MRALVVGATGPTGSFIVKGLRERGDRVAIFHRGFVVRTSSIGGAANAACFVYPPPRLALRGLVRENLDWLDRSLGPIRK